MIHDIEGIPCEQQRLLYQQSPLDDNQNLSHYHITEEINDIVTIEMHASSLQLLDSLRDIIKSDFRHTDSSQNIYNNFSADPALSSRFHPCDINADRNQHRVRKV